MKNRTIYINLRQQFNSIYKHNRQGSKQTKHRYKEAFLRFLVFLADRFRLERLANISPKHIHAYATYLMEKGCTVAYMKTEFAAIRFFHRQIHRAKYRTEDLPDNNQLNLGKRKIGGVDRRWSGLEFNRMLALVSQMGLEIYVAIFCLARYAGLRLHECFKLDTHAAQQALKTGKLTVRGKGGLVRTVPINLSIEIELKKMLAVTPRGHKLFVESDDQTHRAMKRLENFIDEYRDKVQDQDSTRPLTFHGLRHTYAAEKYMRFVEEGMSDREACLKVSNLLGHGRASVTRIYLAGLDQLGGDVDDQ